MTSKTRERMIISAKITSLYMLLMKLEQTEGYVGVNMPHPLEGEFTSVEAVREEIARLRLLL